MPNSTLLPPARSIDNKPVVVAPGDPKAVASLQEYLIERALEARASDLHIEPRLEHLRIRVRVDGWLHDLEALPAWLHPSLVARLKITAGLDVTERRRPQDGRSSTQHRTGTVDLRVSSLPTQHGEKIVIRLLPRSRRPLDLVQLGLDAHGQATIGSLIQQPQGMILAAGPTGAGKTTTLYALLRRIDAIGRNIITLEDPIEYELPNVVQVPVKRAIGFDFASALRAVLRQDPDVILLGEIRDEESAMIAVRAAITGHLVLSTVHTNSALESVGRLLELGVPAHLLASALIGVISQRLVRRLCSACRRPDRPAENLRQVLSLPPEGNGARYWGASGCVDCREGFSGRIGLFETLVFDGPMRRMLADDGNLHGVESYAIESGLLQPIGEAARSAVRSGWTSVEEATRVVRSV
jgi:type II secretory ATPase GspE/PulE/Tfp pilus assembly ATPase PilB-like protein